MSKKNKVLIILGSALLIIIISVRSFYFVLRVNSKRIDNFLVKTEENAQNKKVEEIVKKQGNQEAKKIIDAHEKVKNSKLNNRKNPEIIPENIHESRGYKKAWESINAINRIALWIRSRENSGIDNPSVSNDDLLEGMFFLTSMLSPSTFNNLLNLDADSVYYASLDAMYSPNLRWETKYFLVQMLGERQEQRALPLFREIITDGNEALLLRISAIDQIGILKDYDSNDLILDLLNDESSVMRNKAAAILRDTAERGDDNTYQQILSHYYMEENSEVRSCLLGTAINIKQKESFPDINKMLKFANPNEREAVAIEVGYIPSKESFEILRELYDPQNKDLSIIVSGSMAKLDIEEADQFLCEIIGQANGIISVIAAGDLLDYKKAEAIPYIEEALVKETNPEFINNYQEILAKFQTQ